MSKITTEKFLTDKEIEDLVFDYIDKSSYNYALLIDGDWGSGKTFFVKNCLIPALMKKYSSNTEERKNDSCFTKCFKRGKTHIEKKDKKKKIVYVSLYGITSKEEITRQILMELLPFSKIINSNGFKMVSSLGKTVMGGLLSFKGINFPDNTFDSNDFISLENCILIFDDLERCNMNVNEVLGYINNFVEHDGIKTIIIANEKEIAKIKLITNKELKLIVAANNHLKISDDEETNNSYFDGNGNKNSDNKIDIKELNRRMNTIFCEDDIYKQIKEKLIGVTIYFKPDIGNVIATFLGDTTFHKVTKEVILDNKEFIIEKLDNSQNQNIRTLLISFDKFNQVVECLTKNIDDKVIKHVLNEIFQYLLVFSIHYKENLYLPKWEENTEVDMVSFSENVMHISKYMKGFRFINQLILTSTLDKEKAVEVVKNYIVNLKNEMVDHNDPLYKLRNDLWFMEDKEASDLINQVNQALLKEPEKYDISNYFKIITLNISLTRIGVTSTNLEEILEIMKNNIKYFDIDREYDVFGMGISNFKDKEDEELYSDCRKKLNEYLKKYLEETNKIELDLFFDNHDTWVDNVKEYVENNESKIMGNKGFLRIFDIGKLLEALKNSKIKQIFEFRGIINRKVYSFSNINEYYSADKEVVDKLIKELKDYVNKIKDKERLKTYNLEFLINDLEDILKRLDKE